MSDEKKSYAEREREALAAFALSVALDPNSTPDDIVQAQRTLARGDDRTSIDDFAATAPAWKLVALQALLAEPEFAPGLMGLQHRIKDVVMRSK